MNSQITNFLTKFGEIAKTKEFWAGIIIGFFIGAIVM